MFALRAVCGLVILLVFAGCRRPAVPSVSASGPRIVSLSPALSRMLVDLGCGPRIVGRSRYCDFLDPAIPAVGDLRSIDFERLVALRPTHVVVQAEAAGVSPALRELADERGWSLHAWAGLDDLADVRRVLRELPAALAEPGAERDALLAAVARLERSLDHALIDGAGFGGSTLVVVGTKPPLCAGTATYLGEIIERLGAANAAPGPDWPRLTLEDVSRLRPEGIILIAPGSTAPADEALGPLARLDVPAVAAGRLAVVRDPGGLLPSTSLVAVAEELRAILSGWSEPSP